MTNIKIDPALLQLTGQPEAEIYGEQFEIVSRTAYLIGVPKRIFEKDHEPPQLDIYDLLDNEKKARIIRNLCILRTQLERYFLKVCQGIQREGRSIMGMPEYIPIEALQALYDDGIDIYKNLKDPSPFLFNLNQNIKNRINNCRDLFPDWMNWEYLSDIFIMPNGMTEAGTKVAAEFYYNNIQYYPYQQYINWPAEDCGNILYCDKKFVQLLYQWHGDEFNNVSLVSDVGERTKSNIYSFIEYSKKCVFVVDCENSDPYALCAAIRNLDQERLSKIDKIILFDDIHAASAWEILASYIDLNVEYIMIERLKDNKSLADIKVAARTCKEYYTNEVDSFVIVSSDSDYWGLMEELPEAKFLVMVEHEKCSGALKQALINKGIFYCYIDDFYAGGAEEIKSDALYRELSRRVEAALEIDLYQLMTDALERTRIEMTEKEIKKHINQLQNNINLCVSDDGVVHIHLKRKR